jgi:hypothetical protein
MDGTSEGHTNNRRGKRLHQYLGSVYKPSEENLPKRTLFKWNSSLDNDNNKDVGSEADSTCRPATCELLDQDDDSDSSATSGSSESGTGSERNSSCCVTGDAVAMEDCAMSSCCDDDVYGETLEYRMEIMSGKGMNEL